MWVLQHVWITQSILIIIGSIVVSDVTTNVINYVIDVWLVELYKCKEFICEIQEYNFKHHVGVITTFFYQGYNMVFLKIQRFTRANNWTMLGWGIGVYQYSRKTSHMMSYIRVWIVEIVTQWDSCVMVVNVLNGKRR